MQPPVESPDAPEEPSKRISEKRFSRGITVKKSVKAKYSITAKTPEDLEAAAAKKLKAEEETLHLNALKELMSLLRVAPNAQGALDLSSTDMLSAAQVLSALERADDPRTLFKEAGCDVSTAARGAHLLPLALASRTEGSQGRTWCRCPGIALHMQLAASFLFVAASLFGAATFLAINEKRGWKSGNCNILKFWNTTFKKPCIGLCRFDVTVKSDNQILSKVDWEPKRKIDIVTSRVTWLGEGFRCCDMEGTLECCSFLNMDTMRFCDKWPGLTDRQGASCPDGNWPCLFKLDAANDKSVKELIVDFDQELMVNLYYASAPFLLVALVLSMLRPLRRCTLACLSVAHHKQHTLATAKLNKEESAKQGNVAPVRHSVAQLDGCRSTLKEASSPRSRLEPPSNPDPDAFEEQTQAESPESHARPSRFQEGGTQEDHHVEKKSRRDIFVEVKAQMMANDGGGLRELAKKAEQETKPEFSRPIMTPVQNFRTQTGLDSPRRESPRRARGARRVPTADPAVAWAWSVGDRPKGSAKGLRISQMSQELGRVVQDPPTSWAWGEQGKPGNANVNTSPQSPHAWPASPLGTWPSGCPVLAGPGRPDEGEPRLTDQKKRDHHATWGARTTPQTR